MSEIIKNRRHPQLESKLDSYKLVSDSYRGGQVYHDAGHLWRLSTREPEQQFQDRQKRAIYLNVIKPINDILSAKIYDQEITRTYPDSLKFIEDNISGGSGITAFMRNVATHSAMYTIAVLVDSPSEEELSTVSNLKEQIEKGLLPYAKIYKPWHIRDFHYDKYGNLKWILLDDTYIDNSDPMGKPEKRKIYTLWDESEFIKYEIKVNERTGEETAVVIERGQHGIGYTPVRLVNWQEIDGDNIADTPFEDAAIIARQIYNVMSYLDEMLAAGTFKHLFYPAKNPKDIPPEFLKSGISGAVVTTYDGQSGVPMFLGAGLEDVAPFLAAINHYKSEIMAIFGMDEDHDKKYVQSGTAKSLEFSKSETLLRSAASQLEEFEEWMITTIAKWFNTPLNQEIEVEYQKQYQTEDIESQIARLFQVTMTPYDMVNKHAYAEIVQKVLSNLENDEMKKVLDEIFSTEEQPSMGTSVNTNNQSPTAETGSQNNTGDQNTETGSETQ